MKILLLQYLQPRIDPLAVENTETFYFLGLMARLADHDIRLRLHPESRKREHYKGLWPGLKFDNESRPFRKSLAWPDLVIGPAFSGAMLESLAAGKRTLMVLLAPHSCNLSYFRGAKVFTSLDAVEHAARTFTDPDCKEFLERYTARKEIPDPVGKIWAALVA